MTHRDQLSVVCNVVFLLFGMTSPALAQDQTVQKDALYSKILNEQRPLKISSLKMAKDTRYRSNGYTDSVEIRATQTGPCDKAVRAALEGTEQDDSPEVRQAALKRLAAICQPSRHPMRRGGSSRSLEGRPGLMG